jgi:hypothetical protein
MMYIHMIKPKGLHFTLISLNKFTIQIIHIYKDVRRIQKDMEEDQIKLESNTFNYDLIIINYNQIIQSHIFSYHIQSQLYGVYIF